MDNVELMRENVKDVDRKAIMKENKNETKSLKKRKGNKQLLTSQEHIFNQKDGKRIRQKQKEKKSNIEEVSERGEAARLISTLPLSALLSPPWNGSLKSLD